MNKLNIYKIALGLAAISLAGILILIFNGNIAQSGPFFIAFFILLAVGFRGFPLLRGLSFVITILAVSAMALYYPQYFIRYKGYELSELILPLVQVIMFGMGCSMGVKDFVELARSPKAVLVGVVSQYTIMPLLGFAIAKFSNFPPEISAGVILLGCSSTSVTASVYSYLAKANAVLAITITSITTLLAPLLIPLLMKMYAGDFVKIDVLPMMWSVIKMVLIPIAAGLLFNKFLSGRAKWLDDAMPLVSMIGVAVIVTIIVAAGRNSILNIGPELVLDVVLLTVLGYFFGYWAARLFKINERDSRAIAISTGMQNAGLVTGIAKIMGKIGTVGLAPAICGPIMGFTSSILGSYWASHLPKENLTNEKVEEVQTLNV